MSKQASRSSLYALRWPQQADNRHYADMAEEEAVSRYQPDEQADEPDPSQDPFLPPGSPLAEPRLWMARATAKLECPRCLQTFRFTGGYQWHLANRTGRRSCVREDLAQAI